MARNRGSINKQPGKAEMESYLMMLRKAAKGGDIQAAAALVQRDTALRTGDVHGEQR